MEEELQTYALHEIETEHQHITPDGNTLAKTYIKVNGLTADAAYEQYQRVSRDVRLRTPSE